MLSSTEKFRLRRVTNKLKEVKDQLKEAGFGQSQIESYLIETLRRSDPQLSDLFSKEQKCSEQLLTQLVTNSIAQRQNNLEDTLSSLEIALATQLGLLKEVPKSEQAQTMKPSKGKQNAKKDRKKNNLKKRKASVKNNPDDSTQPQNIFKVNNQEVITNIFKRPADTAGQSSLFCFMPRPDSIMQQRQELRKNLREIHLFKAMLERQIMGELDQTSASQHFEGSNDIFEISEGLR